MTRETLERLLIDRQLGELPPDVSELLDAYTAQNAAPAEMQLSIHKTLDLARRAIRPADADDAAVLPPLSSSGAGQRLTARRPRLGAWTSKAALAASILLAFFLGTRFNLPPPAPSGTRILVDAGLAPERLSEDGFWTLSGREPSPARLTKGRQHLGWSAPFSPLWKGERS